ncbi:MAG: pitrilysin family protein [Actinobacteria bacterium]|nr:pitrilysin family protein [Actinomycetota bacterium]
MQRGVGPVHRPASGQKAGSTRTLLTESDGGLVRRTVLPGGLRVITEAMPTVRSVAIGMWVGAGSRDETPAVAGSAHFLEHLLFKGTPSRSALDISGALDDVGGEMNAFTSKEHTCFYARVLDTDLGVAVDVLADMLSSSLLRSADVESERTVILEEIFMRDDDPGDLVHDLFAQSLFGDTDLGRSVIGTVGTITDVPRNSINRFYKKRYTPDQIVIAVAGNVRHADVVARVKRAFAHSDFFDGTGAPVSGRAPVVRHRSGEPVAVVARETEQAHVVWGVPGISRDDDDRYALGVLNAAFGGGMSSRLFQEVREKRGLAYSVFSFAQHFTDAGIVGIYAGCSPSNLATVLDLCRTEIASVVAHGLTEAEVRRGKAQLSGGLVLGLEDTGSRMSRIAKGELSDDLISVNESLSHIESVTVADVQRVADRLLTASPSLAVIGPYGNAADVADLAG